MAFSVVNVDLAISMCWEYAFHNYFLHACFHALSVLTMATDVQLALLGGKSTKRLENANSHFCLLANSSVSNVTQKQQLVSNVRMATS